LEELKFTQDQIDAANLKREKEYEAHLLQMKITFIIACIGGVCFLVCIILLILGLNGKLCKVKRDTSSAVRMRGESFSANGKKLSQLKAQRSVNRSERSRGKNYRIDLNDIEN